MGWYTNIYIFIVLENPIQKEKFENMIQYGCYEIKKEVSKSMNINHEYSSGLDNFVCKSEDEINKPEDKINESDVS